MKFSSNLGLLVALSPTIRLLVSAKTNSISNLPVTVDDIVGPNASAPPGSCLGAYSFTLEYEGNCKYDQVRERVESYLNNVASSCDHGVDAELKILLGVESEQDVEDTIASLCRDAWENHNSDGYPWADVTGYGSAWDKEYYDGNTHWNEEHETSYNTTLSDTSNANVLKDDAYRIDGLYEDDAQRKAIEFPSHIDNFNQCELRSVMCCWPTDRQANDNNGNCATPYDENCVDADPADNTDLCAVDMDRSKSGSTKVPGGFATFDSDTEGPIHCHGFAWGIDDMEADARYKGNNLFYVSMYDHMYQRGYVRNVPGAPMCGCVERMPIVSRSDCTEIDAEETWRIQWTAGQNMMTTSLEYVDINFNACRGVHRNNDLYEFYKRLRNEGRVSEADFENLKKTVVGHGQCPNAIRNLFFEKGYEVDTSEPEGWTQVYGKGPFTEQESKPALWEIGSPYVKQDGSSSSPVFYIMRKCVDCTLSHKTIIYKRLTPLPEDLNVEALFLYYWTDTPGNTRGVDFDLFSSMDDALAGTDPWQFCNFNHYGVGFPRDCGPTRAVHNQWVSSLWNHGRTDVAFYVWNDNVNIGDPVPLTPTSSPAPQVDRLPISTPNWYHYQSILKFPDGAESGYAIFTVDATNDVHIALGEDTDHNGKHYEIVLGGWANQRSRIRGANQNPTLDEYIGHILQPGVDRKFRISWDVSELRVEVQGGSQWFEIMKFSDRDTSSYNHKIKHMMIATGWGASGEWGVIDYSAGTEDVLFTLNRYLYVPAVEFPEKSVSSGHVTFSVQANNDAHIALGVDTQHNGVHYEIVLGGWGNNHSKIRSGNQGHSLADHPGRVLDGNKHITFRLSWDANVLKVERADDETSNLVEIMRFDGRAGSDYNYEIKYMMVSTGWGATGDWKVLDY